MSDPVFDDPRVERLQASGYPFTLIGRTRDMTGISYVDMDFGDAVGTSLEHLARLGHTCVALFNFPADLLEAGYTSALIARDVFERRASDFGMRAIHLPCSHAPSEAFAVAARLLRSEPDCTDPQLTPAYFFLANSLDQQIASAQMSLEAAKATPLPKKPTGKRSKQ